jgi:outer membrane protein OmpA-like peptidoglycan-associated protein
VKVPRAPLFVRFMFMLGALAIATSGCRIVPQGQAQGTRSLVLAHIRPSVLVIIINQGSLPALRTAGALVESTARPDEQVIILSARGGATLASSDAPGPPTASVPAPPTAPRHPTSFQRARYNQAIQHYRSMVSRDRAALLRQQQRQLNAWAASLIVQADGRPVLQSTRDMSIGADLGVAAADIASMRQAGMPYGTATVVAVMGVDQTVAQSPSVPPADLQTSDVVVDNFSGSVDEQAAWQSSLVQGGAARAVVLTPATNDQLATVVREGLDGAITDTLTSVLFAPGQYTLQPAAIPQMRRLLHLLAVSYPHATANVNGYTDSLPVLGGNLRLSRLRAQEVERWLIAHKIAAGRLQAFGYGDTNPVAPNIPTGQPLNRRVVVVIDPALAA